MNTDKVYAIHNIIMTYIDSFIFLSYMNRRGLNVRERNFSTHLYKIFIFLFLFGLNNLYNFRMITNKLEGILSNFSSAA